MSIKGIDNQLMITRTAELTREADMMRRGSDLLQSQLAAQGMARDLQKTHSVMKTPKSESPELKPGADKEGDGTGDSHFGRGRGGGEDAQSDAQDLLVPGVQRLLDIII